MRKKRMESGGKASVPGVAADEMKKCCRFDYSRGGSASGLRTKRPPAILTTGADGRYKIAELRRALIISNSLSIWPGLGPGNPQPREACRQCVYAVPYLLERPT